MKITNVFNLKTTKVLDPEIARVYSTPVSKLAGKTLQIMDFRKLPLPVSFLRSKSDLRTALIVLLIRRSVQNNLRVRAEQL